MLIKPLSTKKIFFHVFRLDYNLSTEYTFGGRIWWRQRIWGQFEILKTQKCFFLKGRILAKFSAPICNMNELIKVALISSFDD